MKVCGHSTRRITKMHLSIDADGLIYRCGFAVERTKYLVTDPAGLHPASFDNKKSAVESYAPDDGFLLWSRKELEPVENALHLVNQIIGDMPKHDTRTLWLTPSVGNYREQIATIAKYKGNRDYVNRPTYYREITDFLIQKYGARYTVGQEAEDAVGIEISTLSSNGSPCICVSNDKDLEQIPGKHFNWVTKKEYEIDRRSATLFFYGQVLSGDATDNIPGLEGCGPVTAKKILEGCKDPAEAWERCVKAYTDKYGPDGMIRAVETAQLVYIRRKDGEIWTPSTF
jgi:hypothetical protein